MRDRLLQRVRGVRTRGPGLVATLAVVAMTAGLVAATAPAASAHSPGVGATCEGVHLTGTSYDGSKENTWSVTINGVTQSGTFAGRLDKTFPVPQDGTTSSWSGTVQAFDGGYKKTASGTVGPCGSDDEVKKVTYCHVPPGSSENPQLLTTSVSAFYNGGHANHALDIWPAFSYVKHGTTTQVPAHGDQSLLTSGCVTKRTLAAVHVDAIDGCGVYGSLVKPASEGVTYSIEGGSWDVHEGSYVVTATVDSPTHQLQPAPGWSLSGSKKSAITTVDLGTYRECPAGALAAPQVTPIQGCGQDGSVTEPVSEGVEYTIDGGEDWSVTSGQHTVTATLVGEADHFTATDGWTVSQDGRTATKVIDLGAHTDCVVAPALASVNPPSCTEPGSVTVPDQPDGVTVTREGEGPGPVTVHYAPAEGYSFAVGATTSQTLTVLPKATGSDCDEVAGTESGQPGSHPSAPHLLGTQAVVPTAVDAGLTGAASADGFSLRALLAEGLLGGGIALLMVAGMLGRGRRTSGVHDV